MKKHTGKGKDAIKLRNPTCTNLGGVKGHLVTYAFSKQLINTENNQM